MQVATFSISCDHEFSTGEVCEVSYHWNDVEMLLLSLPYNYFLLRCMLEFRDTVKAF